MSATLRDIAAEAKVSRGSVSRILNGRRDERYPEETKARVRAIAKRLGYHPNAAALRLRQGGDGSAFTRAWEEAMDRAVSLDIRATLALPDGTSVGHYDLSASVVATLLLGGAQPQEPQS